ncbi:MAG: hypothetical protein M0Q49_01745 [Porticoccaceae bacterium]|nr:hypothetical protein [Porticoccaceae bacterium]
MLSFWKKARRRFALSLSPELADEIGRHEMAAVQRAVTNAVSAFKREVAKHPPPLKVVVPHYVMPGLKIRQEVYQRQDGAWCPRLSVTWPEVSGPCRVELRQAGQLVEKQFVHESIWVSPGLEAGRRYEVAVSPVVTWRESLTIAHPLGKEGLH